MTIRIRQFENISDKTIPLPDLCWDNDKGSADLAIKDGDLQKENAIWTTIEIQLFSNLRDESLDNFSASEPGGWIGDIIDTDEGIEVGSHIWLERRSNITDKTLRTLQSYADIAMQKLQNQGLFNKFEVEVSANKNYNQVIFDISFYGDSTPEKFNRKFENYWGQLYDRN